MKKVFVLGTSIKEAKEVSKWFGTDLEKSSFVNICLPKDMLEEALKVFLKEGDLVILKTDYLKYLLNCVPVFQIII